jgi:hypothetical protein
VKKILIGFFFLNFIVPGKTWAQMMATAEVYLNVKGTVTLTTVRDLNMGIVVQGISSINVDPIKGGSQAAYFIFVADPNTSVFASFSFTNLTNGTDNIAFTGLLAGNSSSSQSDAVLLTNGSTIETNSSGEYQFWAGGAANLSPSQPFGVYSGTFTLTIAY